MATETKNVRISLIFKGEYDPSISYVPLDVVTWHNSVYICGVAVKGIAPDKYSGSSWWTYGTAYWMQSFLNFRMIDTSVTANGFNYLQTFSQQGHLYTIITRTPTLTNVETQCSEIF